MKRRDPQDPTPAEPVEPGSTQPRRYGRRIDCGGVPVRDPSRPAVPAQAEPGTAGTGVPPESR